ncbi:YdcH family protein [Aestuariibius insulae]|uniref:YdcH family protein n=1 Tax=Aestuariibius insulae TaxID=2058287 RepID=UPI00398E3DEF
MTVHHNPPEKMAKEEVLRIELEVLREEHRDLDASIEALQEKGMGDQLTLQRLKRKKLALKDEIARLEDQITPDIIA